MFAGKALGRRRGGDGTLGHLLRRLDRSHLGLGLGFTRYVAGRGGGSTIAALERLAAFREDADEGSAVDFRLRLHQNLEEDAVGGALNLVGDLVGLHFVEGIALLYCGAFGHEPLGDRSGLHGQAEFWQNKFNAHCCTPE